MALIEAGKLDPSEVTTRMIDRDEAVRAYTEPETKLVVRMN
jgi:hypothetical protein